LLDKRQERSQRRLPAPLVRLA